jgi:PPM family protein phosphatase
VGDLYLLCSDGLSGLVTADQISHILNKNSPEESVARCIKEAKSAGGDDNISVIVIRPLFGS